MACATRSTAALTSQIGEVVWVGGAEVGANCWVLARHGHFGRAVKGVEAIVGNTLLFGAAGMVLINPWSNFDGGIPLGDKTSLAKRCLQTVDWLPGGSIWFRRRQSQVPLRRASFDYRDSFRGEKFFTKGLVDHVGFLTRTTSTLLLLGEVCVSSPFANSDPFTITVSSS